jgi:hypothetical protein
MGSIVRRLYDRSHILRVAHGKGYKYYLPQRLRSLSGRARPGYGSHQDSVQYSPRNQPNDRSRCGKGRNHSEPIHRELGRGRRSDWSKTLETKLQLARADTQKRGNTRLNFLEPD